MRLPRRKQGTVWVDRRWGFWGMEVAGSAAAVGLAWQW
jgi:hypothetical protein